MSSKINATKMIAVLIMAITTAPAAFAQGTASSKKLGLWEKYCLVNNIGNACTRAQKSLEDQIGNTKDAAQSIELWERLETVMERGCELSRRSRCSVKQASVR